MTASDRILQKLFTARTLAGAGIVTPTRPDRILKAVRALHAFGPTPAAGYTVSAIRHPDATALVDDLGTLTFAEVHRRTNALANSLRARGVGEGSSVAIMCRNHRGFIDTTVALSKLGAHALYLNTAFAGPQITEVAEREQPTAIVYDAEFENLVHDAGKGRKRFIAWHDADEPSEDPRLEDLIRTGDISDVEAPGRKGRVVILTSGTTGSPKGAQRRQPESLDPAAALFDMIPLRAREHTMLAAPMFHSWGFAHFTLGMALSSTLVMRRKFDPEDTLSAMAQHECTALVVVPVMLQRMLELPAETVERYDLRALRVIAASGSALPGELALQVMDRFGDVLYNLYGSTEVAWATIATPKDLREAPGTAGRPPRGTVVKLLDENGARGRQGRDRPHLRRQRDGDGRLHRRRRQAGRRRPDVVGRRRPLRRPGPPVRRGPRRRDDRLGRRERVPARGRGPARRAPRGLGGRGRRRRRTSSSASACARSSSSSPAATSSADELKDHVKANLARYKVPREIVFLEELPRNATGKVLKRELARRED